MRSLEIRTKRILNNLIKQNQKLSSDFVLKDSTIVSSAQRLKCSIQRPASNVQRWESRVQRPASRVQSPESRVQSSVSRAQRPESSVQRPASRVQSPASRAQHPESSAQSPPSNSCVQSPGIQVCRSNINCTSINIIHCLKCNMCSKRETYMGKTVGDNIARLNEPTHK